MRRSIHAGNALVASTPSNERFLPLPHDTLALQVCCSNNITDRIRIMARQCTSPQTNISTQTFAPQTRSFLQCSTLLRYHTYSLFVTIYFLLPCPMVCNSQSRLASRMRYLLGKLSVHLSPSDDRHDSPKLRHWCKYSQI